MIDKRQDTVISLEHAIEKATKLILKKRDCLETIVRTVADALLTKITKKIDQASKVRNDKFPVRMTHEEVCDVGNKLVIGGNIHSYYTWLHRDILNSLIEELRDAKVLHSESPFFPVPRQCHRRLIVDMQREIWKDVEVIIKLKRYLLSLPTRSVCNLEEEEIDCVCSFVASAAIFGKILFPGFDRTLLMLKRNRVCLSPAHLEIDLQNQNSGEGGSFYRHFLPAPASLYLLRYLLFCRKKKNELKINHIGYDESPLFHVSPKMVEGFPGIFSRWVEESLKRSGYDSIGRITMASFRRAAILAALVESLSAEENAVTYPPFVLAVQTREVVADSCAWNQFMLNENESGPMEGYRASRFKKKAIRSDDIELCETVNKVRGLVKPLTNKSSLKERRIVATQIESIVLSMKEKLDPVVYENLHLYSLWIITMLRTKRRNSRKKIVNYSATVRSLYKHLPRTAPIYELEMEVFIDSIKLTMDMYQSRNVRKELKAFCDFLKSHLGDKFKMPNWQSKELKKGDVYVQKPLIYASHVEKALDKIEDVFTKYPQKIQDDGKRQSRLLEAKHKCTIISHMVNLGFYAGVRASEFVNLKIENVIYDDGLVIAIRTSKTENGIRNIPLSLLLPDSYLKQFEQYYKKGKEETLTGEDLLFPTYHGDLWDSSHLASEVVRLFHSIGIEEMRFHHLRHAFASWLLVRWFLAFHPEYLTDDMSLAEWEILKGPYVGRLKVIFTGMNHKIGQNSFTYALAVAARLVGHGGPLTTIKTYMHTVDWIFYMISKKSECIEIEITSRQAENFLQVSYPSLPSVFKGRRKKIFAFCDILRYQRAYLQ